MKILGHACIAIRAIDGNRQLLIIGSLLPEMLPYIPNDIFEYNELHEGGKKLLKYLDKNHSEKRDLALGLLSHGVEFGADKFEKESETLVEEKRESILRAIVKVNSIAPEIAKYRLHNYVGLGIDWLLVQNEPELVKEVQKTLREIDIDEISHLLAEGLEKDEVRVRAMVETLFKKIYQAEDLASVEGLAQIWARQASGLPEKDKVNIQKASELIQICAKLLEEKWGKYLENIVNSVKLNLKPFV